MAPKNRPQDMEMLLERAAGPQGAEKVRREKRYIYNGEKPGSAGNTPGYAMRPNKRAVRRRVSTFNIILILFAAAVSAVLYIGNFLAVNQLALDVDRMEARYQEIENANAALRADLNRKSALEHIGAIATERLGLQPPKEQPIWFDVETEKLENVTVQ
jgi:cell division protein FtsB